MRALIIDHFKPVWFDKNFVRDTAIESPSQRKEEMKKKKIRNIVSILKRSWPIKCCILKEHHFFSFLSLPFFLKSYSKDISHPSSVVSSQNAELLLKFQARSQERYAERHSAQRTRLLEFRDNYFLISPPTKNFKQKEGCQCNISFNMFHKE